MTRRSGASTTQSYRVGTGSLGTWTALTRLFNLTSIPISFWSGLHFHGTFILDVVNATITPPWNNNLGIIFARMSRTSSMLMDADMPILFKIANVTTTFLGVLSSNVGFLDTLKMEGGRNSEFRVGFGLLRGGVGMGTMILLGTMRHCKRYRFGSGRDLDSGCCNVPACSFLPSPTLTSTLSNYDHDGLDGGPVLINVAPSPTSCRDYELHVRHMLGLDVDRRRGQCVRLGALARPRRMTVGIREVTMTRLQLEHIPLPGPLILLPSLSVQAADYIRASLSSTSITATFILIAMASLNDYAVNWDLGLNIILSGHDCDHRRPYL
ncbi:hypothetical protein BDZ89DRAFT_1051925 [Hymenopellis radicata]|nr:hypothetical protein BDZ89DRAFT_1051925 [Hymenopellis radicata]